MYADHAINDCVVYMHVYVRHSWMSRLTSRWLYYNIYIIIFFSSFIFLFGVCCSFAFTLIHARRDTRTDNKIKKCIIYSTKFNENTNTHTHALHRRRQTTTATIGKKLSKIKINTFFQVIYHVWFVLLCCIFLRKLLRWILPSPPTHTAQVQSKNRETDKSRCQQKQRNEYLYFLFAPCTTDFRMDSEILFIWCN